MASTFEPVNETTTKFGKNTYLDVSRKKLKEGGATSEFIVISRGYYETDGTKRWTKFITLPADADLRKWLADAILGA